MEQHIQFVGFSIQEAERFLKNIVTGCMDEHQSRQKGTEAEMPLTPLQVSHALKVSLPTLRRYVQLTGNTSWWHNRNKGNFYPALAFVGLCSLFAICEQRTKCLYLYYESS